MSRIFTRTPAPRPSMPAARSRWIHGPVQPMARPPHPLDRAIARLAAIGILLAVAFIILPGVFWLIGGAQ